MVLKNYEEKRYHQLLTDSYMRKAGKSKNGIL